MFRELKREAQELSRDAVDDILASEQWGVLSLIGDGGYPYGVPVNYAYCDGKIYFHGASYGHKYDAMKENERLCFTVVSDDEIVEKEYTTAYASVIVFGRVQRLEGEERREAFIKMTDGLAPRIPHEINVETVNSCTSAAVFSITIEHVTGKVGRLKAEK